MKSPLPDIDIPERLSLWKFILDSMVTHVDKVAMIDIYTEQKYTYADVVDRSKRFASALCKRGFQKGDTLCIMGSNCMDYPIVFLGTIAIGGIVTSINPSYTVDEILKQIKDSRSSFLVTAPDVVGKAKQVARVHDLKEILVFGEVPGCTPVSVFYSDSGSMYSTPDIRPMQDVAALPYSSGTTGRSKGVMLTHRNIIANILQFSNPEISPFLEPFKEVVIAAMPFYHCYGMTIIMLTSLYHGMTLLIMPKFDLIPYLKAMEKYKATVLYLVPPIGLVLTRHPDVPKYDFSSVHSALFGAAPLGPQLEQDVKNITGIKNLQQGYGMTETSPAALQKPRNCDKPGTVGILAPNTEGKVVDVEDGTEVGPNQTGEICLRGPQIMKGYYRNQASTSVTIDTNGWLRTGDIGYYDSEGYFFIVDRVKELIKFMGLQVAPAELEDLLLDHPSVADAAVIGIPDEAAGELPKAYVVIKPHHNLTKQQLQDYIAGKVSPHKKLRGGVEFVLSIPKSPTGKILRRVLKERLTEMKKAKL